MKICTNYDWIKALGLVGIFILLWGDLSTLSTTWTQGENTGWKILLTCFIFLRTKSWLQMLDFQRLLIQTFEGLGIITILLICVRSFFFFNNWETAWKWKRIVVKTMRNFLLWKTPLEMFFVISHNLIKYKSTPHPNFCLFLYNICCTCKHNYIARLYACSYWFIKSIYFRTQLKLKTLLFPPQRINLRILIVETFYKK